MLHHRQLLLVAILAWSVSAMAVHAEGEAPGEPCNALCRLWLGRADRPKEVAPPPVVAAEAPPPVEAPPQDQEPETLPIVRMKRNIVPRTRRSASPPLALQPSDGPGEDGPGAQGAPAGRPVPAATVSQPMDLTPEEAAAPLEPVPAVRPTPIPPRRPMPRIRQARFKRPLPSASQDLPVSLSVTEPQPGSRQVARPALLSGRDRPGRGATLPQVARPAAAPSAAPGARPSAVAMTPPVPLPTSRARPPQPPLVDMSDLRGVLPTASIPSATAPPRVAAPVPATMSALDAGSTSVGRTAPATDPARLHDVAPGPRHALTADSTTLGPVAPKRLDAANPDEALETLKQTILRSAQEALKRSEAHGL